MCLALMAAATLDDFLTFYGYNLFICLFLLLYPVDLIFTYADKLKESLQYVFTISSSSMCFPLFHFLSPFSQQCVAKQSSLS